MKRYYMQWIYAIVTSVVTHDSVEKRYRYAATGVYNNNNMRVLTIAFIRILYARCDRI